MPHLEDRVSVTQATEAGLGILEESVQGVPRAMRSTRSRISSGVPSRRNGGWGQSPPPPARRSRPLHDGPSHLQPRPRALSDQVSATLGTRVLFFFCHVSSSSCADQAGSGRGRGETRRTTRCRSSLRRAAVQPDPAGCSAVCPLPGTPPDVRPRGQVAVDLCVAPNTLVLACEAGTVTRLSGHPPNEDTWDEAETFGWSVTSRPRAATATSSRISGPAPCDSAAPSWQAHSWELSETRRSGPTMCTTASTSPSRNRTPRGVYAGRARAAHWSVGAVERALSRS